MEWEVIPTWWVNAWFIHPSSEVSATTLSTLVCILMFDFAVQYCKLQRYTILVRFPCKILEIYLVRYMIDCEFVMIRGSFGGPFRCNQSRRDIKGSKTLMMFPQVCNTLKHWKIFPHLLSLTLVLKSLSCTSSSHWSSLIPSIWSWFL